MTWSLSSWKGLGSRGSLNWLITFLEGFQFFGLSVNGIKMRMESIQWMEGDSEIFGSDDWMAKRMLSQMGGHIKVDRWRVTICEALSWRLVIGFYWKPSIEKVSNGDSKIERILKTTVLWASSLVLFIELKCEAKQSNRFSRKLVRDL